MNMNTSFTHQEVEVIYELPELELLEETKHYNSGDLVREINKLKKEIYVLRTKG